MKKNLLFIIILFITLSIAGSSQPASIFSEQMFGNNIPRPRLLEPVSDTVNLAGKKELLFKWSPHEGDNFKRKYYDFRLYKGMQMTESNLILKKKVPPTRHRIVVDSSLFKTGGDYTWSLRQKYRTGKSRRSTNTFKVIRQVK